ncbi:hypothetical protein FGO68_gene13889 [Halteria grandinella]|uniref:non-specific serine/threonine protein kinase n=1 Tax=Halteria grandinella TaxID=5974 RepID=A0A8J8NXT7_HALGN|nr:hypothetical protein FGO68_gene13889 [Halteria grandinella]
MLTNKQCAMKIVSQEQVDPQLKMLTELEFLKSTKHPFIIRYFDDFKFPNEFIDKHCIILEYADGCDLRKKMASMNNQVSEQVALNWLAQLCLALEQIHSRGLVHRDIKPDNILIVSEDAGGVAKLGDFGTVKNILFSSKQTYRIGTWQYFAPEKASLKYQGEADIWSLGVVLYEMVSGGLFPFEYDFERGNLDDYMNKLPYLQLRQMPPHLSSSFKTLITKMLEKEPQNRPNIYNIIQTRIISDKIRLFTEQEILGSDKAASIKKQLLDSKIELHQGSKAKKQEQKPVCAQEISAMPSSQSSTATTSIISQKSSSNPSSASVEQQLSQLSLKPATPFTQSSLDRFLQKIKQNKHEKLVDTALLHGFLSLSHLNSNAKYSRSAELLPFEGNCWSDSGWFYGECVEGVREGYGLLYCISKKGNQNLFECEWVKGTPTKGRHVMIDDDNKWHYYEGQIDARLAKTGTGRWEHEDGGTYQGEWKHDRSNGQGKGTYPSGAIYVGEWKDNKMNGQGKMTYSNGAIYEGEWKDDNRHGQGKLTRSDGQTYEGQWQDGKANGEGKWTFKDGTYEVGKWKDDKRIGVRQYFSKQGKHIENRTYEDHVLIKKEKII